VNLENPTLPVKIVMWLPWCTLVLTAVFLANLPWWGVLLVAGFGWQDFIWTTVLWVSATLGAMLFGAPFGLLERVAISAVLVGIAATPGVFLVKKAGLLDE
jgi:hypothetical protein